MSNSNGRSKYIYCNVCNINIKRSEWNIHLNSDDHRKNLFKELPDYSPGKEHIPEESSNFSIVEQKSKYNKHFKAWMIDYNIQINPNINIEQLNDVLNELLNTIKRRTLFRTGDKLNLIVTNPNLSHPISTGLLTISNDINPIVNLGNQLAKILSSNEQISLEECNFHVTVTVIAMPQGQGGGEKIINLKKDVRTKKCTGCLVSASPIFFKSY
jgi:hypothetical protein